ncbi:non-specific serine/threonine protein kinase [Salvia divinorum]|uniref:non-specific serine/threonine protein kinase n=1 Tax=Salvia divinorum TaxID=28513 RepID=A0ABD1FPH2_SALDI
MGNLTYSFALSILLLNSFVLSLNSVTDKHALISFRNSITSDPNAILSTNWSQNTSVCNWIGVSCSLKHGRVSSLNLSRYSLAGTVTPHLGNLTFLRYLDISFNNFTGILPFEFAKLRRLKVMNVGVNSFTGEIPAWLGSLPQLEELYLYSNHFSGSLSSGICDNHPNIKAVDVSTNQISGEIPPNIWKCRDLELLALSFNHFNGKIPSEIGTLKMLRELYLGVNNFQGGVPPELGNLSRLEILDIRGASLTGNIPSSIFNLSSLNYLSFYNNSLSGRIPNNICNNMPNIKTLDLISNQLEGRIPPNIWKCRHVEILGLSYNNLSGSIPRAIGNMSMLSVLRIGYNQITGELPDEIGILSKLEIIGVYNNSLHGSIPSSIFNISTLLRLFTSYNEFSGTLPSDTGRSLVNLEWLVLSNNKLNDPIPTSVTNASKLTTLDISTNSFSGPIPSFGSFKQLQKLILSENNLSGAESPTQELTFLSSLTSCRLLNRLDVSRNPMNGNLPASIRNFSSSLETIEAANCNIMGVIPSEIGNLSSLLLLDLDGNQLSGIIPPTIGKMKQLQSLHLSSNHLVRSIPNEVCKMNNLGELSFAGNLLVGPIPDCLGDVKSLRDIYLDFNQLTSTIPPNLWSLTDLVTLSLSSNSFKGELSSQLGKLKMINSLDLSSNQFSGEIPSIIDGCQTLTSLNLSNNRFSGSIPQSLGNVKGLITLDLSYNNLSGSIPKSLEHLPFLVNFNGSNNQALCGPTTFQVPPCQKNHHKSKLYIFIVPLVIFSVIVVIFMLVLITKAGKKKKVALSHDISSLISECRRVSYIELERGTNYFSTETNLLGRGSFGSVFEATLSDGLKVAVKVFNLELQGAIRSFDVETTILSNIRHRNLVRVIGCCCNMEVKALILTYMPNGSLDKWLHSDMYSLDLIQRLKIAIDVAAALEYLHHGHTFPVVHCDVKPSNVLLNQDMTAHLADFGISKLFDGGETVIQTQTMATIGYAAPEFGMEGKVSTNGDVYSFGILLVEMFTGKKPTDDMFGEERSLKEWVSESLEKNTTEVVAPALLSREDQHYSAKEKCMFSTFELAMKCLAVSADERINMIEAVATLHKIHATIVAGTERRRPRYAFPLGIHNNGV